MGTTQQVKYFQIIEYILFFGLCGLSGVFMHGVLDKFFSGKTNFSQSQEESITELPTITFCFSKPNKSITKYEYGSNFKIRYMIIDKNILKYDSIFLKERENVKLLNETIYLEEIRTLYYGHCFKLTSEMTSNYMIKEETKISIYFNNSIVKEDLPTSSEIFVTSEKNSNGVVFSDYRYGKIIKIQVNKGMVKGIDLKAYRYSYLTTNSKCSHDSLYECLSRLIISDLKKLPSQCSMVSLPSLPVCKINITHEEEENFWSLVKNGSGQCSSIKLCITSEYSGEEAYYANVDNKSISFELIYRIPSNSTTFYEEYYVYDGINTIGSIGGTLGMCIGFSFAGLISSLMNILQCTIVIVKGKFANRKKFKANSQNGLFNDEKEFINKSKPCEILHVEGYSTNEFYLDKTLYQKFEEKLEKAIEALV